MINTTNLTYFDRCLLHSIGSSAARYISDPHSQTVSVAVCEPASALYPQHDLCHTDNVRATLQSLQRREPRRLLAAYSGILSFHLYHAAKDKNVTNSYNF